MKFSMEKKPRVHVTADAMERIRHWTAIAKGEFSCLAELDGNMRVNNAMLLDQESSVDLTTLDQQAVMNLLMVHPAPENVRVWIHSHAGGPVFWSGTDNKCVEALRNDSFLVSIVVNKAGHTLCRIDMWAPFRITLHDVELVPDVPSLGLFEDCQQQFQKHVTEPKYAPWKGGDWEGGRKTERAWWKPRGGTQHAGVQQSAEAVTRQNQLGGELGELAQQQIEEDRAETGFRSHGGYGGAATGRPFGLHDFDEDWPGGD